MSTRASTDAPRTPISDLVWRILIGVALLIVAAVSIRFFIRDTIHYFTDSSPESLGRFVLKPDWIRRHVVGGSLALLMGPLQFWSGLRRRSMVFHRWSGRLYVLGVCIGGIAALYLGVTAEGVMDYRFALLGLWAAWWTTSGMAVLAILKRAIVQHKEWMIRSYGITLAFSLNRVFYDIPSLAHPEISRAGGAIDLDAALMWLCFVPILLGVEAVLQGRKILAERGAV